jgi:hypothetical protein
VVEAKLNRRELHVIPSISKSLNESEQLTEEEGISKIGIKTVPSSTFIEIPQFSRTKNTNLAAFVFVIKKNEVLELVDGSLK